VSALSSASTSITEEASAFLERILALAMDRVILLFSEEGATAASLAMDETEAPPERVAVAVFAVRVAAGTDVGTLILDLPAVTATRKSFELLHVRARVLVVSIFLLIRRGLLLELVLAQGDECGEALSLALELVAAEQLGDVVVAVPVPELATAVEKLRAPVTPTKLTESSLSSSSSSSESGSSSSMSSLSSKSHNEFANWNACCCAA
jgi:hypothetical protein